MQSSNGGEQTLDQRVAATVRAARQRAGLSLDALAHRSGVSRAMLSKIERAETSASAAILWKVCNGLRLTLSALFADDKTASPVSRRADQFTWTDPASGYMRRAVSPSVPGRSVDIVEVTFPSGQRVTIDPLPQPSTDQQIWVLAGTLTVRVGDQAYRLDTGDCLHMSLDHPITFENACEEPVRYAVVITAQP